jgi:Skp family chaperone for outer membrane proteins
MTRLTVAAVLSVMVLSVPALAQQPVVSAPAPAPLKMAFVDLQRVAAESNEGKAASGKVQGLTQKKTAELTEKTKSLQSNQQKLQQGGAVLNEAARAQAQREVDRLTVEIDRFKQDAQAEVQELQEQLQGEFQERLRPIVESIVKELGIGLLFSAGDAGAIFIDPSLDITPEIIKRFDSSATAKPATGAKPTPPAPPAAAKPAPPAPPIAPSAPPAAPPAPPAAGAKPAPPAKP